MPPPLLTTPLHAVHQALGAKLVPFAGWEMPLHYGSQIAEHHAVRRSAGIFDVSHMRAIDVRGAGACDFLRRMLANDVAKLDAPGAALYSCLLREDGGVLDDLITYRLSAGHFRLVANAGTARRDFAWLQQRCAEFPDTVTVTLRDDLAMLALQGPQARDKCWQAVPGLRMATADLQRFHGVIAEEWLVARTGYTGEDGFEIMLPATQAPEVWGRLVSAGMVPCGLGARDTLRLEAGLNLYGQDMDESVTPLECGLAWTVDRSGDRDFVGRRALEHRAVTGQRLGVLLSGAGVMRTGQRLRTAAGDGVLTSGGYAPTLERSIALARTAVGALPGAHAEVELRGRWMSAVLVKPPFVQHGRAAPALAELL